MTWKVLIVAICCYLSCQAEPFVETYWESYLSFPYDENNCYAANSEPNPVDTTAFGYDLKDIPMENIDVVNIAFLSAEDY